MLPTETQTEKDYGSYHIAAADCDKTAIEIVEDSHIMISREFINNSLLIFMKLQ